MLLLWGWFLSSNPLSQIQWSAFSPLLHDDSSIPSVDPGLGGRIADEVVALLPPYSVLMYDGEDPYGDQARYEEIPFDSEPLWRIWETVPEGIRYHARFFNSEAESVLSRLFEDIFSLRTAHGEPVVQDIGPADNDNFIWRARKVSTKSQVGTILENPVSELGPPPPERATPGHMNSSRIPVFYGASDQDTCIAEALPQVGSYVVAGKFKLLKTVRLLNLDLLSQVSSGTTYFDPQYARISYRVAFLRRLAEELMRPVVSADVGEEYLAMRVIAEFLAVKARPRIDGMLFHSSQTPSPGFNVVLFNHASRVQ